MVYVYNGSLLEIIRRQEQFVFDIGSNLNPDVQEVHTDRISRVIAK